MIIAFFSRLDLHLQIVLRRRQRTSGVKSEGTRRILSFVEIKHRLSIHGLIGVQKSSRFVSLTQAQGVAEDDEQRSISDFKNCVAVLKVESGVEAQADGKSLSTPVSLMSDEKGKPTEVRAGSQTFFLIKREERFGIRLKDSNSEARRNFKGRHWFPIDESYKVTARLEAFPEAKEVMVPNVLGGNFKMKRFAIGKAGARIELTSRLESFHRPGFQA